VVVSRLVYRKGVDLLIGILPNVCRLYPNVDFIVAGDGNKLPQLQEMVCRENIHHRIEFLGSVQHAQVRNALVRGDIFLNCSLTESFCIAILEAASCGLFVVSTNVGGVSEVLPPDDMILLAKPNVPDVVRCVIQAIERQSITPTDRWNTHERVKSMYSWERVVIETEQVYDYVRTCPTKTFQKRLLCYRRSLGGFTGYAVCLLALIVETWYQCVERFHPRDEIDRVPDLVLQSVTAVEHATSKAELNIR
jgi:phosphatidylinositol N-acetylglucosaminyltransferase subunit A